MADKFIQTIVELLDKLIDHQSRNASLLTELKSSLTELRSDANEILINLREKLPENLSYDQNENYRRLSSVTEKIEENNTRISENIRLFEQSYQGLRILFDKNGDILNKNTQMLDNIMNVISNKQAEEKELRNTLNSVNGFIESIKSKKTWIALTIAGIAALATMISSVIGGIEIFRKANQQSTQQPNTTTKPVTPIKP